MSQTNIAYLLCKDKHVLHLLNLSNNQGKTSLFLSIPSFGLTHYTIF